ncbi:MAG: restriction endonuclease subunit S [Blautia sp.]|nr:restriction endonuclease subunit S [Blautia sp.]
MTKEIKWRLVKAGEAAKLVTGRTPSKQNSSFYSTEEGIPWVKIENLGHREVSETEEYLTESGAIGGTTIPKGAVLLSTNRTIGKVGIAMRPLQTNQQITAIVCNGDSGILPEYLYYYLKFSVKNIQNMAYSTVANRISKQALEQLILPIAPLSCQTEWITLLECVEDYLWKKEEMLQVIEEYEKYQVNVSPIFRFSKGSGFLGDLRDLTGKMRETIQELLDSLLYSIFGEIEKKKNSYYQSSEQELVLSEEFEKLAPEARKLLLNISSFQRELYRRFYEAGKESAVHQVLKQMKQESADFKDQDIQGALATVEAFRQIGLLKKEDIKLLYDPEGEPTEDNIVRDNSGNDLGIGMWSCIFPKEE